jgi:polyisoprenoid-binding protein YceI
MPSIDATTVIPASTWTVDPSRSSVAFKLRHLMVMPVRGRFTAFEGTLAIARDGRARASGTVQAATIDTNDAVRDERLRAPDFFDTANHPEIAFASSGIETLDEETLLIAGDLTIRGATHELELRARRTAATSERIELELDGELRRSDFGIESAQLLEAGISDKVELALRVSLTKAR